MTVLTLAIVALLAPKQVASPASILVRYEAALTSLESPATQSFDYAVEQLGLRNMEQTHHVYLSGRRERDETTIVDGYVLRRPSVRILTRSNRYDVAAIAPRAGSYTFVYRGAVRSGTHVLYDFATKPVGARSFAVSEVEIDGTHFLPARIYFKISGATARGSGLLEYGRSDKYWVVRNAQVNAHLADGATAHERIAWSNYSFPSALPDSTFDVPHAHVVEPALRSTAPAGAEPLEPN